MNRTPVKQFHGALRPDPTSLAYLVLWPLVFHVLNLHSEDDNAIPRALLGDLIVADWAANYTSSEPRLFAGLLERCLFRRFTGINESLRNRPSPGVDGRDETDFQVSVESAVRNCTCLLWRWAGTRHKEAGF
jgi:hypothetical protein